MGDAARQGSTPAAGDAAGEPCPTPLSVVDVLEQFRQQAEPWTLERAGATVRGRILGEGPPLIFLNGIGGTHELFALQVWLLREEYRCIVFDYPEPARNRNTAGDLADDLFAVAEHHRCKQFFLYATSFGSLVGLAALLRRPDRIPRPILQGAFARRRLSLAERALVRMGRHLPGTVDRLPLREKIEAANHRPWFPPFDTVRWKFFLEDTGQVPIRALAQRGAFVRDTDFRDQIAAISQPVLLIRSEGEGLVSRRSIDELAAGLPNVREEWLHGSGHLPYLTHPHRLAKLIRGFLGEEHHDRRAS